MKRLIIALLCLAALGYLGYSIYSLQLSSGDTPLEGIDVEIQAREGVQLFMNEDDVLAEMKRKGLDMVGTSIDSIDITDIEGQLRANPLFEQAEVYISARTARMKVVLAQREAAYLVQTDKESYYVTRQRGIIPLNPDYAVYVPVVSGTLSQRYATEELYDLMEAIEQDDYFRHYFGHYYVDAREGVILSPRVGRASIILGHDGDWQAMLAKLRIFDQEVIPRKGWNAFEYIKLAYADQVVAKEVGTPSAPSPTTPSAQ